MGILTEYLGKKLERDLREKGLLVWLDKDGVFRPAVAAFRQRPFPYPVFAYEGSFLELMAASRQTLSTRDNPKCLIYMPGFSEETIRETPLLEAYKAGQRWRLSLETLIREAAQGRLSETQTTELVTRPDLGFEMAEACLGAFTDMHPAIRKLQLQYGEDGLVLAFLKDPVAINAALGVEPGPGFALLADCFGRLIGLDDAWREDWNPQPVDYGRPDVQADLVAAYLLAIEFVDDLKIPPPSARLARLKGKPAEYHKKTNALLLQLREREPALYVKWADQVQDSLTDQETHHRPADLGRIDTFRFEADTFIKEAMRLLSASAWKEALELARIRLPGNRQADLAQAFWLQQDRQRLWLWEWIEAAADLGVLIARVSGEIQDLGRKTPDLAEMVARYRDSWWELDRQHRHFVVLCERQKTTGSGEYANAFVTVRRELYTRQRDCTDRQAGLWNKACETGGFLPAADLQQRNFFRTRVQPLLASGKKIVLFIVDALRYELGKELHELLRDEAGKSTVDSLVAELPTITAVGMNALAPVTRDGSLVPLFDPDGGCILGFRGGERDVRTIDARKKTLAESSGRDTEWVVLDDLLEKSGSALKKLTAAPLLVVTALDIDQMGESGALEYGNDYFEMGLSRIKEAVKKLKENGYEEFLITADHGFLIGDESLQDGLAPKLRCVDRRYSIDAPRTDGALVSVGFSALEYRVSEPGRGLIFGRTSGLLINRRGTGFYHGGNTLQERLVPILSLSVGSRDVKKIGQFVFEFEKQAEVLGCHRLRLTLRRSDRADMFSTPEVEVRMVADAGAVVRISAVTGTDRKACGDLLMVPVDTQVEVFFKLEGRLLKSRVGFESFRDSVSLESNQCQEYFEVEATQELLVDAKPGGYPAMIPEMFHPALDHLQKHGSLTEQYLVNSMKGNPVASRRAREFARVIDEWCVRLPFDVVVEQTGEGKEYRLKKRMQA